MYKIEIASCIAFARLACSLWALLSSGAWISSCAQLRRPINYFLMVPVELVILWMNLVFGGERGLVFQISGLIWMLICVV